MPAHSDAEPGGYAHEPEPEPDPQPSAKSAPQSEPRHRPGRGQAPTRRIKREARFGLVVMLSFLILVTLLIKNKVNKEKTRPGEGSPLMSIPVGGPAPSGQASSRARSPHDGAKVAVHATPPPDRHSSSPKPGAPDARTPNSRIVLKPAETFRVAMADDPVALPLPARSTKPSLSDRPADHDASPPAPATPPAALASEPEPGPLRPATQPTASNPAKVPLDATPNEPSMPSQEPTSAQGLMPAQEPAPAQEPVPLPAPAQEPAPPQESPPLPVPAQGPAPQPLPAQGPAPRPIPAPQPAPALEPSPAQGPAPLLSPAREPAPQPASEQGASSPQPVPAPGPEAAITPSPEPAKVQGPTSPGAAELPAQPITEDNGALAELPRSEKAPDLPPRTTPPAVAAPPPAPTEPLAAPTPTPEHPPEAEPKPAIDPSPGVGPKATTEAPPKAEPPPGAEDPSMVEPGPSEPTPKASLVRLPSTRTLSPAAEMPDRPSATPLPEPVPARASELPNFVSPPAPSDPVTLKSGNSGDGPGVWVPLPNVAKRRAGDNVVSLRDAGDAPSRPRSEPITPAEEDQVEPVPHVVQSGENFWTISRLYYGSGRYYLALWQANRRLGLDDPKKLRVGMTIRIPPPEALDRSLIRPPAPAPARSPSSSPTAPLRKMSRAISSDEPADPPTRRTSEVELALPVSDPLSERGTPAADEPDRAPGPRHSPRLPEYKVHPHETLRSIARDTLRDSRRASEILELNQDVIDDPNHLTPGQIIVLPEDARVRRRIR